jgi:hypothetical protein
VASVDPLLPDLAVRVDVTTPDDELRQPETDHALLADMCRLTGGQVLGDLSELPGLLPNRRKVVIGEPEVQTLWDRPIVLALLLVLLTGEWVGRRVIRLT